MDARRDKENALAREIVVLEQEVSEELRKTKLHSYELERAKAASHFNERCEQFRRHEEKLERRLKAVEAKRKREHDEYLRLRDEHQRLIVEVDAARRSRRLHDLSIHAIKSTRICEAIDLADDDDAWRGRVSQLEVAVERERNRTSASFCVLFNPFCRPSARSCASCRNCWKAARVVFAGPSARIGSTASSTSSFYGCVSTVVDPDKRVSRTLRILCGVNFAGIDFDENP